MRKRWAIWVVLCLVPLTARARSKSDPDATSPDRTLSPYFVVEGGDPDVDGMPLKATSATVEIVGVIANVTVKQTYVNEGKRTLHARYVFPASTRAAVHGMRMTVGERVVEAKIRERRQAREEYEEAKREGKSASLLEQQRPNVFTMDVANVLAGDKIDVELRYTELLVPTDGVYELIYPTVVGPRYSNRSEADAPEEDRWVKSPYTREGKAPTYGFALDAKIASGMPIQDVMVPSHKVNVDWSQPTEVKVALDPSETAGGNRDFILRYRLSGKQIESGLLLHEGEKENFFLLMVEPPERVTVDEIPPREYVFIVDVSGSMIGFPLDTSKELLRNLVGSLRPTDTFNVILFSGAHELMSPRSIPATRDNIRRAITLIDGQRGGGGTELLPALQEAMSLPSEERVSRSFVVVTDGYISAETEMFEYVRANLGDANVFSFGIGSSVNHHLVEGVAKAGMGEPFVVTDASVAASTAARFKSYVESPVLTNIRIETAGFKTSDVEPSSIPDLLARRPIVVQGKWSGDAKGTITIKGVTGSGKFERVIDVSKAKRSPRYDALSYLWARGRIARLSDFGDESEEAKAEVTRLGLAYNLLTKHTSFVAVLQEVRNREGGGRDVAQPLPLPRGVGDYAVGAEVGSEPGLLILVLVVAGVAAIALLRRRRLAPR